MNPPDYALKSAVFEPLLAESIHRFFAQHRNGVTDFSDFTSIFSRLLQSLTDPPLEVVWFYSALTSHSEQFSVGDGVAAVKDLFQLLVSSSTSCNGAKRVAVLVPVIYKLYRLALDRAYLKGEVECLLEGVISFMSICCSAESDEDDVLTHSFRDLSCIWMLERAAEDGKTGTDLGDFFPLTSQEVQQRIRTGCSVGYLAGTVMCEAVLLRLCLKFGFGVSRASLEKELQDCASQMVCGFRSFNFLDALIRMLLGPVLPITSVLVCCNPSVLINLGPANEALLREVLINAVITVEHSFVNPSNGIPMSMKQSKDLAVTWLLVMESAILLARERSDQEKVISYMTAFSQSCLLSLLVKWVNDQTNVEMSGSPIASHPLALIKWLLIIEDQGVKVFECDISKIHAKAVLCRSRVECEVSDFTLNCNNLGKISAHSSLEARRDEKVDDVEMIDPSSTLPLHASCLMDSEVANGFRKRKYCNKFEGHTMFKVVKHHFPENPIREKFMHLANEDCFRGSN